MKKYNWNNLSITEKEMVLSRPLLAEDIKISTQVASIINQVKQQGDTALFKLTKEHDRIDLPSLKITPNEIKTALNSTTADVKATIEFAKNQITTYHKANYPTDIQVETQPGVLCTKQYRAIENVGLYIPGGSAPLVSTLLMLAVPAQITKCRNIILCTPPNPMGFIDPNLIVAANLCGLENIYKVGGAQAIAAMAYGTETISKVNKIFGPGNRWVTQAKMQVANDPQGASIDLPAGPSELMIIADDQANPLFVAADLLSQAEHGVDSQVMLVCLSEQFAEKVEVIMNQLLMTLDRKNIITQSLINSRIILVNDVMTAIEISNTYAPEHLILHAEKPENFVTAIQNAGAVFLGKWTPETAGDYVTGSNHVLPTYGYAKNYSGLSIIDFMKTIHFQKVTKQGLKMIGSYAEKLAQIEGLSAHKLAVSIRCEEIE